MQERFTLDGKLRKDVNFSPFELVPHFDPKTGTSYDQLQGYADIEFKSQGGGFREVCCVYMGMRSKQCTSSEWSGHEGAASEPRALEQRPLTRAWPLARHRHACPSAWAPNAPTPCAWWLQVWLVVDPHKHELQWGPSNTEEPVAAIRTGKKAVRVPSAVEFQNRILRVRPHTLEIEAATFTAMREGGSSGGLYKYKQLMEPKERNKLGALRHRRRTRATRLPPSRACRLASHSALAAVPHLPPPVCAAVIRLDVRLPGNKRVFMDFLRTEMRAVMPRGVPDEDLYKLTTDTEKTEAMCERLEWRVFQNTDGWSISWVSLLRVPYPEDVQQAPGVDKCWGLKIHETLHSEQPIQIHQKCIFEIDAHTEVRISIMATAT